MKNIFFFLFLSFCSCSTTSDIATSYINVDEDYPESEFFSSYTYVKLQPSNPMITEISDIRMSNDRIFITDKTSRLFVFSKKGEFINALDKRGHGSNEYVEITDFDIKNNIIYILSRPQKKVYIYFEDGNNIKTLELNDYYSGLRIMSDDRLCLASANSNNQKFDYIIYNMRKQAYTNKLIPFSDDESFLLNSYHPFLGRVNDTLYINKPFSIEVTELRNTEPGWTKKYSFNTKVQLPEAISEYTFEQLQKEFVNKRVVKNLLLYSKTKDYEYIAYELFGKHGLSFYLTQINNNTKEKKTMMSLNDIDKNFPYMSLPCCVVNQSLISSMSAASVLNIEVSYNLSKFKSEGLKGTDNPIIFIHKLK